MQVDNRYLKHHGVDDTKWYVHRFGKWQPQAKYANGKYEDGTSVDSNYGDAKERAKEEKRIEKGKKQARKDAKNDYNIQMADRGNLLSAIKLVSGKTAVANVLAGSVAAASYTSLTTGRAIKGYNKRYGDDASYLTVGSKVRQAKNARKDIQTRLSKSTIKNLKLSKEYVEEYSAAMDKLVNRTKKLNSTVDKFTEKSKVLKSVADKVIKTPKQDTKAVDDKKLLNKLGILASTAAATNLLTTAVTGGTSIAGDVKNVAKTVAKKKLGTVDSTGFPLLNKVETKDELLKAVNPTGNRGLISKFTKGQERNCSGCVTAYEMRLRGYDVQAGKYVKDATYNWAEEYFPGSRTITWAGESETGSLPNNGVITRQMATNFVNALSRQGPGSRGAACVFWKNDWGGHTLNYEVDSAGKLFFIDGQTREVINNPINYLADRTSGFHTTQLNGFEFDPSKIGKILS